jgi:uncharacterized protein YacL
MPKKKTKQIKKTLKTKDTNKASRVDAARTLSSEVLGNLMLPRKVVMQIADEVGKVVSQKITIRRRKSKKSSTKIDNPILLDTSAIIDMRVFDLAKIGALYGTFIVLESVLSELKNIADSNEAIIDHAKKYKGRIITCDYNLAKKAKISNVIAIDLYEMTNILKTQALPGEEFFVKIVQEGKGIGQGVGYLPDGTMLVVEQAKTMLGKTVQVQVSRIIQTDAGKILFSKIKPESN